MEYKFFKFTETKNSSKVACFLLRVLLFIRCVESMKRLSPCYSTVLFRSRFCIALNGRTAVYDEFG
jgi:hypothetical protein